MNNINSIYDTNNEALFNEFDTWFHKSRDNQKLFILLINEFNRTSIITKDDNKICDYQLYNELNQNPSLIKYLNLILQYQGLQIESLIGAYELISTVEDLQPEDEDDSSFVKFANWLDNRQVKFTTSDNSLQTFLALHAYYGQNHDDIEEPVTVSLTNFKNYTTELFENSEYQPTITKTLINRFARYKMTSPVTNMKFENQENNEGFKIYNTINRNFNPIHIEKLKQLVTNTQINQQEKNINDK